MTITTIDWFRFFVPFRRTVRHASATRRAAENIIVRIRLADGSLGYGEGCPRSYVTGETVESAEAFLAAEAGAFQKNVGSVADLRAWIAEYEARIDAAPAAFCALELAALDAFGQSQDQPVDVLLGGEPMLRRFSYSAVIGDSHPLLTWWLARRYRWMGFRDLKLKLSRSAIRDRWKTRLLQPGWRLRVDANNAFETAETAIAHIRCLDERPWAIEEPLAARDFDGFREVAEACRAKIILDESLVRLADLEAAGDGPWIANIRVSKVGGLIRALALGREAVKRGAPIVIGSQVGETSILTRAGLSLAHDLSDSVLAMEGAFGSLLLTTDVVGTPLQFGGGGVLVSDDGLAQAPGLGLTVDFVPTGG